MVYSSEYRFVFYDFFSNRSETKSCSAPYIFEKIGVLSSEISSFKVRPTFKTYYAHKNKKIKKIRSLFKCVVSHHKIVQCGILYHKIQKINRTFVTTRVFVWRLSFLWTKPRQTAFSKGQQTPYCENQSIVLVKGQPRFALRDERRKR